MSFALHSKHLLRNVNLKGLSSIGNGNDQASCPGVHRFLSKLKPHLQAQVVMVVVAGSQFSMVSYVFPLTVKAKKILLFSCLFVFSRGLIMSISIYFGLSLDLCSSSILTWL